MARKPRIHFPGGIYHVMLRGNDRQPIFFSNEDRYRFYLLLQEFLTRCEHRIHAFCLMSNHVHLAIQVGDIPLSKLMQLLSFSYTRWINTRYQRVGHLFQGRYKAILVEQESYLAELVRYIHLNPVRANLVTCATDYHWSGHRAYLGMEELSWFTTDCVLSIFAEELTSARMQYQQFIVEGVGIKNQKEYLCGNQKSIPILGTDNFLEQLARVAHIRPKSKLTLPQIAEYVCAGYKLVPSALNQSLRTHGYSKIRAMIAWLAVELRICNLTTAAAFFERDVTNLSRSIRTLMQDVTAKNELTLLKDRLNEMSISQA